MLQRRDTGRATAVSHRKWSKAEACLLAGVYDRGMPLGEKSSAEACRTDCGRRRRYALLRGTNGEGTLRRETDRAGQSGVHF